MSRLRTLKPELFRCRELASVPPEARWTFGGLLCAVDDDGRAQDDPRLIKADIYPLDDVAAADVDKHLAMLAAEDCGLVCRYTVDGKRFLHVPHFRDPSSTAQRTPWGQRPSKAYPSRWPPCPLPHTPDGQLPLAFAEHSENGSGPDRERSAIKKPIVHSPESIGHKPEAIGQGATARARPLPDDWQPSAALTAWAEREYPGLDWQRETANFRDYWLSTAKDPNKRDWDRTWQTWMRRADDRGDSRRHRGGSGGDSEGIHIPVDDNY